MVHPISVLEVKRNEGEGGRGAGGDRVVTYFSGSGTYDNGTKIDPPKMPTKAA